MIARLGYREVATNYGCAYTNDVYRVIEEMAERVPSVNYKESRTLCVEDARGVGAITSKSRTPIPTLRGGFEPTKPTRENGGR